MSYNKIMKLKEHIEQNKPWKTFCLVNTKSIPDLRDENTHLFYIEDENFCSINKDPEKLHPKLLEAEPLKTFMVDDQLFCFLFFEGTTAGYIKEGEKALLALFGNEVLQEGIEAVPCKPFA